MRSKHVVWKSVGILLLASFFLLFSVYQWGSYSYSDQVAVLAYHHLSEKEQSSVTITPQLFREQLSYLKRKGYHFITLDQFKQYIEGAPVPKKAVLVTFDDGYESFYTYGYPVLQELRIPAVNFVITKDLDHPKATHLPSLSREEIREMKRQSDLVDFQCHSHGLHAKANGKPLLTSYLLADGKPETQDEYRARIVNDTQKCINGLYELHNKKVDTYAYPFGMYHKEASELVQQGGIGYAFTVTSRMATRKDDPLQLPRINAGNPSITPKKLHKTIIRRAIKCKLSTVQT
ncbi:polysaccharide deacetylase family protein [Paenibacillus sp. NPDC056579]|uniref:polysaccharide deacetylase family protein n=1 Tax=Paenibacillus sp. NPDC056579 TaxID=3345871 RepID=UPI0036CCD106